MTLSESINELDRRNAQLVIEVVRARDAIMGLTRMYHSITEGLADVADRKYFTVAGANAYQKLYQRQGTQAKLIATYPSKEQLQELVDAVGPLQTAIADHETAANPHSQYVLQSELKDLLGDLPQGGGGDPADSDYLLKVDAEAALLGKADVDHTHPHYANIDDVLSGLAGKANASHDHDLRYPTKTELETELTALNAAIAAQLEEQDTRGELSAFMSGSDSDDVPLKGGVSVPTLAKYLSENEYEVTRGRIPDDYTDGPIQLIVDGEKTLHSFRNVDSYRPQAGDSVIALRDVIVGVVAENEPLMESFCKYYGYPISINGYWDVEEAAQFYATFDGMVWGDGYGDPLHEVHDSTVAIAARIKELRPSTKIFGYVPIGMDPAWPDSNYSIPEIKVMIDNWYDTGATHIFLDEFGYDYFITRDRQNELVQYCHDKGMNVCANSWSADYCFSNRNIILTWADNFEGNPNELPSLLTDQDYIQFENMLYKYHHEPGQGSTADPDQWVNDNQRIVDMYEYMYGSEPEFDGRSYYDVYGTRGYALDAIIDYDRKMFTEGYLVALALGMHAYAASVAFWGAATSTYHTYPKPNLRAQSRVALRPAQAFTYADTYVGKVKTQVGPELIEITWVQAEDEMNFNEESINDQNERLKHIFAVEIPPDVQVLTDGYFTLTLGDNTDAALGMSTSVSAEDTQQTLLDKIANYSYSAEFTGIYEVIREDNRVVFQSREPYTETNEIFWVWHTDGMLSTTINSFTVLQEGSDGLAKDYREVMLNGSAVDFGFGPFWRRPRTVEPGYIYYDTSNNRNIIYRDRKWFDLQGNLAEEFVNYPTQKENDARYYSKDEVDAMVAAIQPTSVPSGVISIWSGTLANMPDGWVICDGRNGTPDLRARFVFGTDSDLYPVGSTGGSTDAVVVEHNHLASTNKSGTHSHSGTTESSGAHTHTFNANEGYSGGTTLPGSRNDNGNNTTHRTNSAGAHTHSLSTNDSGDHTHKITVDTAGESGKDKNLPPYYALAYIMKL